MIKSVKKRKRERDPSSVPGGTKKVGGSGACSARGASVDVDLDALFSGLGAKKKVAADAAAKAVTARAADAAAAARVDSKNRANLEALEAAGRAANSGGRPDSPVALRFDTELGVRVFSVAGLKIGAGSGNTKDCPFDCSCCY